mmetsp:Transcript_8368/g.28836  ORF Transcript_8368/g.28836 Transcript_8368/m.28836 type:complete len:389 (-) Transcript_8368:200-1366(-)
MIPRGRVNRRVDGAGGCPADMFHQVNFTGLRPAAVLGVRRQEPQRGPEASLAGRQLGANVDAAVEPVALVLRVQPRRRVVAAAQPLAARRDAQHAVLHPCILFAPGGIMLKLLVRRVVDPAITRRLEAPTARVGQADVVEIVKPDEFPLVFGQPPRGQFEALHLSVVEGVVDLELGLVHGSHEPRAHVRDQFVETGAIRRRLKRTHGPSHGPDALHVVQRRQEHGPSFESVYEKPDEILRLRGARLLAQLAQQRLQLAHRCPPRRRTLGHRDVLEPAVAGRVADSAQAAAAAAAAAGAPADAAADADVAAGAWDGTRERKVTAAALAALAPAEAQVAQLRLASVAPRRVPRPRGRLEDAADAADGGEASAAEVGQHGSGDVRSAADRL